LVQANFYCPQKYIHVEDTDFNTQVERSCASEIR